MGITWLRNHVPDFGALEDSEVSAIVDFSLLWSLFEARILDKNASAARIVDKISQWSAEETLNPRIYNDQFAYFQERYFEDGQPTYHFQYLNFRPNDQTALVTRALEDQTASAEDKVAAVFIIVWRYRNNLFHGPKWEYGLRDQKENFEHANSAMMLALEQHGQLLA